MSHGRTTKNEQRATNEPALPTGYAFGGWTRADRIGTGVQSRLQASVVVLQRGKRKVALVSVDLFASPGGLVAEAAKRAGHGSGSMTVASAERSGHPPLDD